jgi:selenide, water dikinase
LKERNIEFRGNLRVVEVTPEKVILSDGSEITCDVAVWATGADPHGVTAESDLDIMKGFFRVNDFLQSTSHPNVFGGGDCITMENYADKPFPTKAGVYAVREGPFITQNIFKFISKQPMVKYVPQDGFLSLMMCGDGEAIGSKFGICF